MRYPIVPIGELVTLRQGFAINKNTKHHMSDVPTQLHLLRIGDMKEGTFSVFVKDTIPSHFIATEKDIIYTRTGQVGLVFRNQYGVIHNNCFTVAPKNNLQLSRDYLYYVLQSNDFYEEANAKASGAAQPDLPHGAFNSICIPLPSISKQDKIASILSYYDNLIENNQKQIKLLEEAAQRLYKEWFIDLRFPGHESTPIHDGIPEGWEKTSLEEVISFNPKYVLPKEGEKRVFPMASLGTSSMILDWSESELSTSTSGTRFSNGDTLLARITPCLENGKTAFVDGLLDGEVATGSTEFIVMQSKAISPYMVYLLARNSDFRETAINSMTGSDGRQRAQVDKLKQYPYLRPSQLIIDQFGTFAAPIFTQIHGLNKQNYDLQEARDRLLPKLMSGEIEV